MKSFSSICRTMVNVKPSGTFTSASGSRTASTFDFGKIVSASDGFSGSEIEQAVVAALYRALHQKTPLTTDLLIEELTHTVPLSVTRREDIDALRQTAEGRFVSVR